MFGFPQRTQKSAFQTRDCLAIFWEPWNNFTVTGGHLHYPKGSDSMWEKSQKLCQGKWLLLLRSLALIFRTRVLVGSFVNWTSILRHKHGLWETKGCRINGEIRQNWLWNLNHQTTRTHHLKTMAPRPGALSLSLALGTGLASICL